MTTSIENAFSGALGSIEALVRAIVRDELRTHLGPEADHLINVKNGPMSANKLRRLVLTGELRGYKEGRDAFISASEFRAFVERRPIAPPAHLMIPEAVIDPDQDEVDDVLVAIGGAPSDPAEHRAFEARLAQRRAEGGERAAALRRAEAEHAKSVEVERRREERRQKRAMRKRRRPVVFVRIDRPA